MTIGGIQRGSGSNAVTSSGAGRMEKDVQTEISRLQSQINKLGSDPELDPGKKSEKKQELSAKISELQKELRQYRMEISKEKREQMARQMNEADEQKDQKGAAKETGTPVHSLLQGMNQDQLNQVLTRAEGKREEKLSIMESEIRLDKRRGEDTRKREERLEDLEAKGRLQTRFKSPEDQKDGGRMSIIQKKGAGMKPFGNQEGAINFNTGSYQL